MTSQPNCTVGHAAPEFELEAATPAMEVARVTLRDFRGRWLAIVFYPRDFSFVCPTELIAFSADKQRFDQRNCDLLGVSIDDLQSHLRWMKTPADEGGVQGLRFSLASDPNGSVCKKFGLWREVDQLPNRGLFLVDPDGVLRYAASYDLSVGRNVEDVIRTLDALQSGGLCPATWKRADGVLDVASMLQPGRVMGNYRIERELGQGAFGKVFAADDLRLQRKVAMKVIMRQDQGKGLDLLREARSAAGISHPNVCTVYSADELDNLPTIVMEYVEGSSLAELIGNGQARRQLRSIASGVTAGLLAAHMRGVVHGDLKPANILIRQNGEPVIVDFGLAHSLRAEPTGFDVEATESVSAEDSIGGIKSLVDDDIDPEMTAILAEQGSADVMETMSQRGRVSGTPAYMSPEQARGDRLTPASDIFSLGLIFIQILRGESVMDGKSSLEIIMSLQDRKFVESLTRKIPEPFTTGMSEMLQMYPQERPTARNVLGWVTSDSHW